MPKPDYNKIKADYIAGKSYRQLSEKYGIPESTLRKKGAKEQWRRLRNKTGTKTEQKIVERIADRQADRAIQISDVAEALLRQIALQVAAGTFADSQSIKQITGALKDIKELKGDDKADEAIRIVWSDETDKYNG
ncbi:MAG: hypothetical protein IKR26_04495 [Lachnospiraceae bacterium]|nr:hypothetical protein [Lachnospiraceae bacterium]